MAQDTDKQRIVILGGGPAGLAAAWGLTSTPGWQDEREVHVYSQGWRLGGKCATGRNPEEGYRVQEHGLHLWFGFYENCFRMIRQVFDELDRPEGAPIRTWDEALVGNNLFTMAQYWNDAWVLWPLECPVNTSTPGNGHATPSIVDYLEEAIQLLADIWWTYTRDLTWRQWATLLVGLGLTAVKEAEDIVALLIKARGDLRHLGDRVVREAVIDPLRSVKTLAWRVFGPRIDSDLPSYRAWISIEFVCVNLIGMIQAHVDERGFDVLNEYEYTDWLRSLDMSQVTLESSFVQAAYDSCFALFHRADNPDIETGTVLRGGLRLFLLYKGHIMYRFKAGTGDSVIAPLYEVLAARGVQFHFFHEVTEVVAGEDGEGRPIVSAVRLDRQVDLKDPAAGYQPLIDVGGLPCWPDRPRWEQIENGEALAASGVDLEDWWKQYTPAGQVEIHAECDFDRVILAMSIGGLPFLTPTLMAASQPWADMCTRIQTVRTQAFQLWTVPDTAALGYAPGNPVVSTFVEPLDTWGDYTLALSTEAWDVPAPPAGLGFFCGAMTVGPDASPPRSDHGYPEQQNAIVHDYAVSWIEQNLSDLWPHTRARSGGFDWSVLFAKDTGAPTGPDRFGTQFWQANVCPSERYVLSVTGSSRYRIPSDGAPFVNLLLAGDWTRNGLNAGCVEAAVQSGLVCSRALCGVPEDIPGLDDGIPGV